MSLVPMILRHHLSPGTRFRYSPTCSYVNQIAVVEVQGNEDGTKTGWDLLEGPPGTRRPSHHLCPVAVLPAKWVELQQATGRETSHLGKTDIRPARPQPPGLVTASHAEEKAGDLKAGRGDRKPPLMWVPLWALTGVARVFAYGARKYAPGNWQKAAADGADALGDYLSAFQRHWGAIQEADPGGVAKWDALDEESGLPHLDHAICSLVMLRGIAILAKILPRDPGRGLDPVKTGDTGGRKP